MDQDTDKEVLSEIFCDEIRHRFNLGNQSMAMKNVPTVYLESVISDLEKRNLVQRSVNGSPKLTEDGRRKLRVVMAGGAFDIIHPGHLETLEKAKSLGDVLIVSVARNVTTERNKGRKPIHDEKQRRRLVDALKPVNAAVLGSEKDIFETVDMLKPDVIALGYDQTHSEEKMRQEVKKRGLDVEIVRLDSSVPEIKSAKILANQKELSGL